MRLNYSSDISMDAKIGQDLLVRGLVEAEAILPSQYFDRLGDRTAGEFKLLLAVLTDGINCFLQEGPKRHRLFLEARDWIIMPYRTGPFSFDSICDALEIEANTLRKRPISLRRLRSQQRLNETSGTDSKRVDMLRRMRAQL